MSAEFANRELKLFSPEEYLLIEEQAEYRSEYFNGRIYAMAGASSNHVYINFNIAGEIRSQLRGKSCRGGTNDMRVKIGLPDVYVYPDTIIACDPILIENNTLLNPVVIIEVLSPSTEADDRGVKFEAYKRLLSLREYILVAQDKIRCEQFIRHSDNSWKCKIYADNSDILILESVECEIALAEIYYDITFHADESR